MLGILDIHKVLLSHSAIDGGAQFQVYPIQDDILFSYERESGQIFYRRKITKGLLLRRDDFSAIMAVENDADNRCEPFAVEVYNIPLDQTIFLGYAYLDKSRFDLDRCEIELFVDSIDETTPFVRGWDTEVNLLDDAIDKTDVYTNFQDISTPVSAISLQNTSETISNPTSIDDFTNSGFPSTSDGWVMIQDDVTVNSYSSPTSFSATRKTYWARELADGSYDDGPAPPGDEDPGSWYKVEESGPNWKWARKIYAFEKTSESTSTGYTAGTGLGTTVFYAYHKVFDWLPFHAPVLQNGVTLEDCIVALLDGTGLTPKSIYFGINESFSAGSLPYDEQRYADIVVFQKTDIMRPDAADPATQLYVSRKRFFEQLAAMYQVYAVVIGSDLRIEHISYFEALHGIDFTSGDYSAALNGRQRYTYQNEQRETKITFGQADMPYYYISKVNDTSLEFGHMSWQLSLNATCPVEAYERIILADLCANDIQMIHAEPGAFTEEGMCFVSTFVYDDQYIASVPLSNKRFNVLHCPNILALYHFRHNLPFGSFEVLPQFGQGITPIPNPSYSAESIRPRKLQEQIEVPLDDITEFAPYKRQQTQFGWGVVDSAEYSLRNRVLSITLLHEE